MSYINLLSSDLLLDFLPPMEALKFCLAYDIKSTKILRKLESYLISHMPKCKFCETRDFDLMQYRADMYLCKDHIVVCDQCNYITFPISKLNMDVWSTFHIF